MLGALGDLREFVPHMCLKATTPVPYHERRFVQFLH